MNVKLCFYELQYTYGRRSKEIATLKVSDVNFITNEITFNIAKKKETTNLTLDLLDTIKTKLENHIKKHDLKPDNYLFI